MSEENTQDEVPETGEYTPNFDPKEVEAQLMEQAQARADDPGEAAATMYHMYVPHFKRLMPGISTRGLRRVLNYMVLYPFEQDSIKAATELEKQFMQLCGSLMEAKFILIMDSYNANAKQLYEAQNSPLTEEQKSDAANNLRAAGVSEEVISQLSKQHEENKNV